MPAGKSRGCTEAHIGTASRVGGRAVEIGDRDPEASAATAEGSGQVGWRSHRPRAEKDPFRMGNSFPIGCMRPDRFYVCLCRSMEINQRVPGDLSPVVVLC